MTPSNLLDEFQYPVMKLYKTLFPLSGNMISLLHQRMVWAQMDRT